ncbi:hypothetical protein Pyrde_0720 [Pyrodictium delaneyi]|uniref:Uncharacterized protein n=1 Tax=Pyrodictium delaneyi TaxID=1273541 RepID=A0A0P0N342_9CREN|nr:hypothetical protein Pyrde_0720 [Pyrodictium delaneyi]
MPGLGVVVLHARVVKYSGDRVCLYPPAEQQEELKKLHGETIPVIVILPEKEAGDRDRLEQAMKKIAATLSLIAQALFYGGPRQRMFVPKIEQHLRELQQLLEKG